MARDIRVPGVLWALVLIAVIAIVHENGGAFGLDPVYVDVIVLALIGVLKTVNLGDGQLQLALDVIESIRKSSAGRRSRGTADAPAGLGPEAAMVESLATDAPPRPNKTVRWLVG